MNIHALSGIRIRYLGNQAAADSTALKLSQFFIKLVQ
jgi:hypothetical protein